MLPAGTRSLLHSLILHRSHCITSSTIPGLNSSPGNRALVLFTDEAHLPCVMITVSKQLLEPGTSSLQPMRWMGVARVAAHSGPVGLLLLAGLETWV